MSLLADLLSKSKKGSSGDAKKSPSTLNVPPTLSKARGFNAKVPKLNSRYTILSGVVVLFIAVGVFVIVKSGMLKSAVQQNLPLPPQPVAQIPPLLKAVPFTPLSSQARISLEEPPAPEPEKKIQRPPKLRSSRRVTQRIERPRQQPAPMPAEKTVAPPKIDTAAKDSYLYAARSAEQKSDWKSALTSYRKAQEVDPGDYKLMSNVAAVLNNLGLFDEGVLEAERALAKKKDYVPALINAAIGYSSKGNTQKALRYFTYASALDPSNRSLVINMGILHERAGNLDDALATYSRLADDGDPLALHGMARVYERKGNKSEAVRAYRRIIAQPNVTPALKQEVKRTLARMEE